MQAVFRLIEHDGTRRLHHLVGHFRAAMRGKTVEKHGVRRGVGHQRVIHLVRREYRGARIGLALLPHAGPDVRVYSLCAGNSFFRSAE